MPAPERFESGPILRRPEDWWLGVVVAESACHAGGRVGSSTSTTSTADALFTALEQSRPKLSRRGAPTCSSTR